MSALDINARLKSLSEANRSVSQLISRLSKLSSSSDLQNDDEQTRVELSAEIHQSFKELEEDFELVKQEAEDITTTGSWTSGARRSTNTERDKERVAIVTQVERLGEDLKLARTQFRKAQLQARRNAEAARRKEREQLFASVQEGESRPGRRRGQEKLSQDELILNASNDVTAALRRTHQLMQAELQRSQFAHETLQQSTAALSSLNESYSTLDTLLASSKSLVSTLLSSQKSDTWYLETAFWILVYTIAWLVFRRIFYGPIRYLLYLPTKWMLNIFISFVNLLFGLAAGSEGVESAQRSSTSLVVQPSASGRGTHRFNPNMAKPSVPSGAGGQGAKIGKEEADKEGEGLADKIGKMAEETQQQEEEQQHGGSARNEDLESHEAEDEEQDEDEEESEEQSGTVLREPTEEETPNPKKRMWEEPGEGGEHDEL